MASYEELSGNCCSMEEEKRVALRKNMTLYVGCGHKYIGAGCAFYAGCIRETVVSHVHIIDCADVTKIDVFDPVLDFLFESFDQLCEPRM